MTWFGWFFVALCCANTAVTISTIGKPRKPTEHSTAVVVTLLNALLIWGAVTVGTIA